MGTYPPYYEALAADRRASLLRTADHARHARSARLSRRAARTAPRPTMTPVPTTPAAPAPAPAGRTPVGAGCRAA